MRQPLLKAYYFATPALWLADILWGINVRAAGFENYPLMKHLYFAACVGCAFAMWKIPAWSLPIGLIESVTNILSLILGLLGPYYKFIGSVSEDMTALPNPLTMPMVINFILAGSAACISFYGGGFSKLGPPHVD